MYAFVKYKDNHRAIMPVSLIENLAPTSTEDIPQRTVRAYWRSSDGEDEGHYDANVVLLGATRDALITEIAKKKRMAVPKVFEDLSLTTPACAVAVTAKAQKANRIKAKKRLMSAIAEKKKRQHLEIDTDSSGDELVEKRLLKKAVEEGDKLRRKLRESQETTRRLTAALLYNIEASLPNASLQQDAVRDCSHGGAMAKEGVEKVASTTRKFSTSGRHADSALTNGAEDVHPSGHFAGAGGKHADSALTNGAEEVHPSSHFAGAGGKHGSALTNEAKEVHPSGHFAGGKHAGSALAKEVHPSGHCVGGKHADSALTNEAEEVHPSGHFAGAGGKHEDSALIKEVAQKENHPTSCLGGAKKKARVAVAPNAVPPRSDSGNHDFPAELAEIDGRVHLKYGIFVTSQQLQKAMLKAKTDSKFTKLITRSVYTDEELMNRSLTGQPSRRNIKLGANGKRELTPRKVDAIGVALGHFVDSRIREGVTREARVGAVRGILSNFLVDHNRADERAAKRAIAKSQQ
uniref:Putative signal recognition particle protein n=1 Tax=Ixodes ricinus TaxID=34613 RepID=A0A6B0VC77_IXORI